MKAEINTHSPTRKSLTLSVFVAPLVLAACGGGGDSGPAVATAPVIVASAATTCAALSGKTIDASLLGEPSAGAVVTAATFKPAVADAPNSAGTATVAGTPDYCQTLIDIKPVDPTAPIIKAQVNMPATWNGKTLQMGGGGTNGTLVTGLAPSTQQGPETPLYLTQGYVTMGTDSGHQNSATVNTGAFALNDEALTNYAYASYKKTHDLGIQLALAFYNATPAKAYYIGGSEGGREGMIMAQKYPKDFNGIVTIDPVIRLMGLWMRQLSSGQVQTTASSWLGGKLQLVDDTVAAACDSLDGIADRVVSNYKACKPLADAALAAKRCASGTDEGATCFSDGQLAALVWNYNGQTFPFALANGITSYPGYLYGSEIVGGLGTWSTGTTLPTEAGGGGRSWSIGQTFVRYFVTKDPNAVTLTFNPALYQARIQALSALFDMTNPDLTAFQANGGKLIMREDLSDKGNGGQTGFDYYDSVVAKMGQGTVDQFFVAYGATGVGHTSGGSDAGTLNAPTYGTPGHIDMVGLLDTWVSNGTKPDASLTLTNRSALAPYPVIASKPMCRYGFYPRFVGASPAGGNLAANYTCTAM